MANQEKIFVTGATGFIGTRLTQALVERGHLVRALCRREQVPAPPGFGPGKPGPLQHPAVELVRGDITDAVSMLRGMVGCSRVFHLAAYARNWAPDPRTFYRMNVAGMANVFAAARQLGITRVVLTSSIVTLGPTGRGVVGDEAMPRLTQEYLTEYEATKATAERQALEWAAGGFPVVIVNPTRVFGPGHLTEGNSVSRLIDDYDRGRMPLLINRGVNVGNYVLVDDVVQGHLLAMERGRVGERYILGGENATLRQLFRLIDRVSGKRHFQVLARPFIPLLFAWLQKKRAEWFGTFPTITPGWVRTFLVDWAYRSDKAVRELGYRPTPLEEGIRITYDWLHRLRQEGA